MEREPQRGRAAAGLGGEASSPPAPGAMPWPFALAAIESLFLGPVQESHWRWMGQHRSSAHTSPGWQVGLDSGAQTPPSVAWPCGDRRQMPLAVPEQGTGLGCLSLARGGTEGQESPCLIATGTSEAGAPSPASAAKGSSAREVSLGGGHGGTSTSFARTRCP